MLDLKKDSKELFLEKLRSNVTTSEPVNEKTIVLGTPVTLPPESSVNTAIAVKGTQDLGFSTDKIVVNYNRVDLSLLFQGNYTPSVSGPSQSSLYRLLPTINKIVGLSLNEDDIQDVDIVSLGEGEEVSIELRAKPGSLAYVGYTSIVFHRDFAVLSDNIQTNTFEDLVHPDPIVDGYVSVGLMTWGRDFTLIKDALAVNKTAAWGRGDYADPTLLKEKLSLEYGIEGWPTVDRGMDENGTVTDYSVDQVPTANREFDRVVIQTDVASNGYIGTAYFHYKI